MFNSGYIYSQLSSNPGSSSEIRREIQYKFKSSKRIYHVIAEEYDHKIYAIKFYASIHKNFQHKYNVVLNDNDAFKVIRTVFDITLSILKKEELASFGFLASPTISNDKQEDKSETKRYNIYKYLISNYLGEKQFTHATDPKYSAYILINNKNKDPKNLLEKASKLFVDLYPYLENIDTSPISISRPG